MYNGSDFFKTSHHFLHHRSASDMFYLIIYLFIFIFM